MQAVVHSVTLCPPAARARLLSSIIVCGGVSAMPGLAGMLQVLDSVLTC